MKYLLTSLIVLMPTAAYSAIGLDASSVAEDCQNLNGKLSYPRTNEYECVATGYTVEFYLNSAKLVGRISWHGRTTPPLATLLGSYTQEYQTAFAQNPPQTGISRHAVVHESQNLRVKRSGNGRLHVGEITLKSAN